MPFKTRKRRKFSIIVYEKKTVLNVKLWIYEDTVEKKGIKQMKQDLNMYYGLQQGDDDRVDAYKKSSLDESKHKVVLPPYTRSYSNIKIAPFSTRSVRLQ